MTHGALQLEELRRELGPRLRSAEQVAPPPGVSSGWTALDRFLLWQGFPKSAVSLLVSESGGATTLWLKSAALVTKARQWSAWVNAPDRSLTSWGLQHRSVQLDRFIYVSAPQDERQLLWMLQELMSLDLFELIGCDLGSWEFRDHQILKLKKLALRHQTALVVCRQKPPRRLSSFYSLILHFHQQQVKVVRALHRPTPHILERRDLYADTLPQLAAGRRALCG